MTTGIDNLLNQMASFLKQRNDQLGRIASFWHGFEGWLKFELAASFSGKYGQPWVRANSEWTHGYVGMEHRHPQLRDGGSQKLIDLWVYPKRQKGTYYFELKTVFRNNNRCKQIRSWAADFEALGDVLRADKDVLGYASVLFGVGFSEEDWKAIRRVEDLEPHLRDVGLLSGHLADATVRMAALRRDVGQQ